MNDKTLGNADTVLITLEHIIETHGVDIDKLKTKVLDQRISLNNMADRVIALEDQLDDLIALTDNLLKLYERQL